MYGLATIGQIKGGKHMYRAMEAHFSLFLTFYKLHMEAHFSLFLTFYKLHMTRLIYNNQEFVKELKESVMNAISDLSEYVKEKKDPVKHSHEYLLADMRSIKFTGFTGCI